MSDGNHLVNFAFFLAIFLPPALLVGYLFGRWNAQTDSMINSDPDGTKKTGERVANTLGQICLVLLYGGAGLWLFGSSAVLLIDLMQAVSNRSMSHIPDSRTLLFTILTMAVAATIWLWSARILKYTNR